MHIQDCILSVVFNFIPTYANSGLTRLLPNKLEINNLYFSIRNVPVKIEFIMKSNTRLKRFADGISTWPQSIITRLILTSEKEGHVLKIIEKEKTNKPIRSRAFIYREQRINLKAEFDIMQGKFILSHIFYDGFYNPNNNNPDFAGINYSFIVTSWTGGL